MAGREFLKNSEISKRTLARMRQTGERFAVARRAVVDAWLSENPPSPPHKPEYPFTERDGLEPHQHSFSAFETKRRNH